MSGQVVASGATWGISGPGFLGLYAGLVLLVMVGVAVRRRGLRPVVPTGPVWLHPYEVAYLNGGAPGAAQTVLVGVGGAGVVTPGPGEEKVALTRRGPPPRVTRPGPAAIAPA